MAMPSSNPAYIFDESGKLVDWCPDPGDATFQKGIYMGGEKIDSDSFQKKFGIETPGTPPGHND